MLDLRRLRLLRELARRGTVTAVAEAMGYSPSAVSQQLAALEKEAGVVLLEPSGRRLRLTPQAEVLVQHTDRLLAELERAEAALAAAAAEVVGTLRVAAFQTALLALLPGVLQRLADEHPELRIEVTEAEPESSLPDLGTGRFDLVLAEEYPGQPLRRQPATERIELFQDPLQLAIPKTWPQRSLPALQGQALVLEPPGTAAHGWASATCRTAGFEPDVRHVSADLQIHLALVEHGLAAALLPDLAGAQRRAGVHLHPLPGAPTRTVFAAVRDGGAQHPAVLACTRTLVKAHEELIAKQH